MTRERFGKDSEPKPASETTPPIDAEQTFWDKAQIEQGIHMLDIDFKGNGDRILAINARLERDTIPADERETLMQELNDLESKSEKILERRAFLAEGLEDVDTDWKTAKKRMN